MTNSAIQRLCLVSCIAWLVLVNNLAFALDQAQAKLQTLTLNIEGARLDAEIASTPDQRYMGLSFRKTLLENEAMLFAYPEEQALTFTMRNTLLPLSIAYISEDFVILEIHDMPVGPGQLFPSKVPAKFALEVNQGWFERNQIGVGAKITRELD